MGVSFTLRPPKPPNAPKWLSGMLSAGVNADARRAVTRREHTRASPTSSSSAVWLALESRPSPSRLS